MFCRWFAWIAPLMIVACNTSPEPEPAPSNRSAASSAQPSTRASATSSASAEPVTSTKPTASAKPPATPPKPEELAAGSRFANSSNAFGFDLYKELRKTAGNLAVSPTSLSIALAMTWGGAKSETANEMKQVLHFVRSPADTMSDAGTLTKLLENPSRPLQLSVANRLFGQKSYTFEQPYLDSTEKAFGASLEMVDFELATESARKTINGWVEQKTERRIVDLVPQGGLDAKTRLVLVNAVYFLADWEHPFDKASTREAPFTLSAAKEVKTPTMQATRMFNYAEVGDTNLIELSYKGGEMSMLLAIPRQVEGIEKLEQSMSQDKFAAWSKAMKREYIRLFMPRFEVNPTQSLSLASDLQKLGMKAAFKADKADFTGIANPPKPEDRLAISQVFHKAFVKVDEKGTEAAAASAVVMGDLNKSVKQKPVPREVKVDRPFVYFIRDNQTGLILFMGRVADPTKK